MKIFRLSQPENGWIDMTFGTDSNEYTLTVSGVPNDCLGDLAAAASRLLHTSTSELVKFSLEPDFATCRLIRTSELFTLSLTLPNDAEPVYTLTCPFHSFAKRVGFEMQKIREFFAIDSGWPHAFPDHVVKNLLESEAGSLGLV